MKRLPWMLIWVAAAVAAPVHVEQSVFDTGAEGTAAGWTAWAVRDEIAPPAFCRRE